MGKGEFSGRNMQKKRKKMRWLSKRWKRKKLKLWAKYSVLGKAPLGKGIVLEKKTLEQKQPHSGLIKCVKVQLIKNGRVATAFAPRNGAINYIDEHDIQKLIIDVRYNDGGNGRTMIPFINEIIKRDRFCNGENLYVLVGNRTYSASVIFMTELAVHTDVIFVGSPPSSPFNFFSDMLRYENLPNSGAGLGIASRQIDNAWSSQTIYFSPDIPAPFSSKDYFSGKDPALEMALKGNFLSVAEYTAINGAEKGKQYLQELWYHRLL